jgi:O-antigen/teichoic acid export membrane protein
MKHDGIRKRLVKFWRSATRSVVSSNVNKDSQADRSGKRGGLKNRLLRAAMGSFGLKIASTGLGFLISLLLARLLGASGFGVYAYVVAWTTLVSIPATLGIDQLIVREFAVYQTQSSWGLMRGLLQWAVQRVLMVSVAIALVLVSIVWFLSQGAESPMPFAFCVGMLSLPIASLRNLRVSAMQGLHQVVKGQLPEMLFAPIFLLVFIGCGYLLLGSRLTAIWVLAMNLVATAITLWIGMKWLNKALPNAVWQVEPEYDVKTWLRSALPFMFLLGVFAIFSRTDMVMLGLLKGSASVGVYAAVNRAVQLINFIVMAVNGVLAPTIASLYAEGKIEQIKRLITKSTLNVVLISFPLGFGLILFGSWYLLLFGESFIVGKTALIILSVAQIIRSAMGWDHMLLNMTGHEKLTAITVAIGASLNIVLNAFWIPQWGLDGAAVATAISTVVVHVALGITVFKKLGF